jgi:hypothetical protein
MDTPETPVCGIQFAPDAAGKRSSTTAGRDIAAAALLPLDPEASTRAGHERDWRHRYPRHLRRLVETQAARPGLVLASCQAGLDAAWSGLHFIRDGQPITLRQAMDTPASPPLHTCTLRGQGSSAPRPWTLPYRGRRLSGDALARHLDDWEQRGVVEASHAQALRMAMANPEWFDLSDRTLVLLGAGSEAGPLAWLLQWRANVVAIDLAEPARWRTMAQQVLAGNATLTAARACDAAAPGSSAADLSQAGCDLLTQAPEIAAWLESLQRPLDIASIAYADGEKHVRLSLAMDAVGSTLCAADARTTLAWMATPTDVFAVPEALASQVMRVHAQRGGVGRLAQRAVHAASAGRLFAPHIERLVNASDGSRWGVVDGLVIEQGPNYALAKRLQQWRALVARAAGHLASIRVAPPTTTASVLHNRMMTAAYRGAGAFGVEVFEPPTTSAIVAALWVHDLRNPASTASPAVALEHPLQLLVDGANHGGLWRSPWLPRSVLPLAALRGLLRRS